MKSIQEIAKQCSEYFDRDFAYDWRFAEKKNCLESLWKLIDYTSDEYLFKFLQFSLDSISKICQSESTPDEMRLSRDWSEPDFPEWDTPALWQWFISDPSHLDQVQVHVSVACELDVEADLNTCIQCAVWDEWRGVFEATRVYLIEAYSAQPEDEDCDDE